MPDACPHLTAAFAVLGKRWTGVILGVVRSGPVRFTDLHRSIPGLSDKVLAERLQELASSGLIERVDAEQANCAGRAGSCVYRLTETGEKLGPALDAIGAWARAELEPAR
jgi:DNA-binding HxlR family transcriptional regulator